MDWWWLLCGLSASCVIGGGVWLAKAHRARALRRHMERVRREQAPYIAAGEEARRRLEAMVGAGGPLVLPLIRVTPTKYLIWRQDGFYEAP